MLDERSTNAGRALVEPTSSCKRSTGNTAIYRRVFGSAECRSDVLFAAAVFRRFSSARSRWRWRRKCSRRRSLCVATSRHGATRCRGWEFVSVLCADVRPGNSDTAGRSCLGRHVPLILRRAESLYNAPRSVRRSTPCIVNSHAHTTQLVHKILQVKLHKRGRTKL